MIIRRLFGAYLKNSSILSMRTASLVGEPSTPQGCSLDYPKASFSSLISLVLIIQLFVIEPIILQMYHFIRDYYDLRGHQSAEEKKRTEMAACLKEMEAGQKNAKPSLKHHEAEQGRLKEVQ